jgi:hypothetical protein
VSAFAFISQASRSRASKLKRFKDKFSFYKDSTNNWALGSNEIYKVQACVSIRADFIAEKTMSFSRDPKYEHLIHMTQTIWENTYQLFKPQTKYSHIVNTV